MIINKSELNKKIFKKKFKLSIFLFFGSFCLLILYISYLTFFRFFLIYEIKSTPRDPISGIVFGTEARTLQPSPESDLKTAVLLIHGFASSRQDFGDLGENLCHQGYTIREMRLPGHGSTPVEFAYQDRDALYSAAEAELKLLQKDFSRIILVGFSTGGALCSTLAAKNEITALILLAPLYRIHYNYLHILPAEWLCQGTAWVLPYFIRPMFFIKLNKRENIGKFFFYQTIPNRGVQQIIKASKSANDPQTLQQITAPVLWCHSPQDGATSYHAAKKAVSQMSSKIKEAYTAERSNHILMLDYDAEAIKEKIILFLNDLK